MPWFSHLQLQPKTLVAAFQVFSGKSFWKSKREAGFTFQEACERLAGSVFSLCLYIKLSVLSTPSATMPKYTLVKKLGQGAFGTVSLIESSNREKFAVKTVKTSDIGEEAKIMSRLKHPNVVVCFHTFSRGFYTYLIMEFCDGGTLSSFIRSQPRPINENTVLRMLCEIAAALQYLHHEKKIYHRDLKPDNILLSGSAQTVKVGDIGLGRMVDYSHQARGPYQMGTPIYMSPEMISFQMHTAKTDIWSFGCCVHELMTRDYTITNPNVLHRPVIPIPAIQHPYSKALKDLVLKKMLQKDPQKRPNAREVLVTAENIGGAPYRPRPFTPVPQTSAIFDEAEIVEVLRRRPQSAQATRTAEPSTPWGAIGAIGAGVLGIGALALGALIGAKGGERGNRN